MDNVQNYGTVEATQPIMISGVYRSGTTFLSAMLGAHPELIASSSTIKFLRFCIGRYGDITEKDNCKLLISETHKRVRVRWGLPINEEKILNELESYEEVSYALIYDLMMRNMLLDGQERATRWIEKLAVQWEDVPLFLDMFPNGKVIHIIRDPRDVAASYKAMTFEPGNTFLDAAFNYRGALETLEAISEQYGERLMLVKAEDIAKNPELLAREMCDFLELPFDHAMVDSDKLHTEGEEWSSNTSFGKEYKKLPDAKSRWPEHLSRSEVIFIEMITQPYFSSQGYESSNFEPTQDDWDKVYQYMNEPFLAERFKNWLFNGRGGQGYRTDPYIHEMKIVFPERFNNE